MLLQRDRQFFVVSTLRTTLKSAHSGEAAVTTPTVMWSYGRPVMSTNDDDVADVTVSWSYGKAVIYHDAN